MLTRLVHKIEEYFDWVKYSLGARRKNSRDLMIIPYLGCGTTRHVEVKGRVLEDVGIQPSRESDSIWDNLLNMYRRFESDEVPFARVKAYFQGLEQVVEADEEGFFEISLRTETPFPNKTQWHSIDLELLSPGNPGKKKVVSEGRVLVISDMAEYGVISDLDDTVVQTGVTSRFKLVSTILFKNAYTRIPLRGVASFYNALQQGRDGVDKNPLFYVSSSPWNMYDLFREFFQINEIPDGPIFLRDWGFERHSMLAVNNRKYKLETISKILRRFPELKFILIGDSGEEDPEIYSQVIQSNPERILGAYIRDVKHDKHREEEIRVLAGDVERFGSVLVLAEDAHIMSEHAARQGWIGSSAVSQPVK